MEWRAPEWRDPESWPLLACVLLLIVSLLRGRLKAGAVLSPRIGATDMLLVLGFTVAALRASYFFPYFGIGVLPILGTCLVRVLPSLAIDRESAAGRTEALWNRLLVLAGAFAIPALMLSLPQAQTGAQPRVDTRVPYPEAAVRCLAQWPAGSRIYNEFGWGGFLIYRLYPDVRVFIDGRVDLFRGQVFDDFKRVYQLVPGWRDTLAQYRVDGAPVGSGTALDGALSADPAWCAEQRDALASLYRRRASTGRGCSCEP